MTNKIVSTSFLLGTMLMFTSQKALAQDPEFTQFYAIPLYTNPAMTGTSQCDRGGGRAAVNYRNQWPNLPGGFITTAVSYDQHVNSLNSGLGIIALHDRAGEGLLITNQVSALYSYKMALNKSKLFLRVGVEGQIMQRGLDWSKLRWEDQIDATRGFVNQTSEPIPPSNVSSTNFNSGVLMYSEQFYIGAAVHNILEPNQSFYFSNTATLLRRFTAHAGYVIPLGNSGSADSIALRPNILFMQQGQFNQVNLTCLYNVNFVNAGFGIRHTYGALATMDAVILTCGYRGKRWKFGYSYDLTIDEKRIAARGSHEVSAIYEWCSKKGTGKRRSDSSSAFW